MKADRSWSEDRRLGGLRRFAVAITILNILGHSWFGFEQSIAQPIVAVATAYVLELMLEWTRARASGQRPAFLPCVTGTKAVLVHLANFLLPAHITGLAVAMLLYANEQLMPIVLASATAIGSKYIFRAPVGPSTRHFFNPSNLGISVTLLLLPWVGIAPPYHFTENLLDYGDWLFPAIITASGTFINTRFSRKVPLIGGWLLGFVAQAMLRSWMMGTPLVAALAPMTGVAFILFTFYMVTDPATTPGDSLRQFVFGLAVASAYGLLMTVHIVFGFFFALSIVCAVRGILLHVRSWIAASALSARAPSALSARAPQSVVQPTVSVRDGV